MLADGVITTPALLELYIERIARLNPQLNAYRVVRLDAARVEAATAQQRLDAGKRLALLGCPWQSRMMSTSPVRSRP
jgi:amidase